MRILQMIGKEFGIGRGTLRKFIADKIKSMFTSECKMSTCEFADHCPLTSTNIRLRAMVYISFFVYLMSELLPRSTYYIQFFLIFSKQLFYVFLLYTEYIQFYHIMHILYKWIRKQMKFNLFLYYSSAYHDTSDMQLNNAGNCISFTLCIS